jgi:uncharacterized membrane protein
MESLLHGVAQVARSNHEWVTWNLTLAFIPALLAIVLFGSPGRRGAGWWCGVAAFVLFLPNAPYVVTDLVHLRGDVLAAPSDGVVLVGVLPMYVAFIVAGFVAYVVSLELARTELRRRAPALAGPWFEPAAHLLCSIGIVLGRIARLNSWDVATSPTSALERAVLTLSWRGAPFAVVIVFVAVTVTYAVVKVLTHAVVRRAPLLLP